MRIQVSQPVNIVITDQDTIRQLNTKLKHIMEVAAIKALEAAVERTPAAGEGPYSTGQLRQSLRVQKTGDLEFELYAPQAYALYVEFGTGPRGAGSGRIADFPNDPDINYHEGEVLVTRHAGRILEFPYIRKTLGMQAQPYLRPALLKGVDTIIELLGR